MIIIIFYCRAICKVSLIFYDFACTIVFVIIVFFFCRMLDFLSTIKGSLLINYVIKEN